MKFPKVQPWHEVPFDNALRQPFTERQLRLIKRYQHISLCDTLWQIRHKVTAVAIASHLAAHLTRSDNDIIRAIVAMFVGMEVKANSSKKGASNGRRTR